MTRRRPPYRPKDAEVACLPATSRLSFAETIRYDHRDHGDLK